MSVPQTVEPEIQEEILDVLPEDYDAAMNVMCQLLANMMIFGKAPWSVAKTFETINTYLAQYEMTN